jgi:hypothetical protein
VDEEEHQEGTGKNEVNPSGSTVKMRSEMLSRMALVEAPRTEAFFVEGNVC